MANRMTLNALIELCEGRIRDSLVAKTLPDHLYEAGIQHHGQQKYKEVIAYFAKNLAVGKPFEKLAGSKVLRDQSLKRMEGWVGDRNIAAGRSIHAPPVFKTTLASELDHFIESNQNLLPPTVVRAATQLVERPPNIALYMALIESLWTETRVALSEANSRRDSFLLAQQNAALTQKLLAFDTAESVIN